VAKTNGGGSGVIFVTKDTRKEASRREGPPDFGQENEGGSRRNNAAESRREFFGERGGRVVQGVLYSFIGLLLEGGGEFSRACWVVVKRKSESFARALNTWTEEV